jgi:drug/metabolite transporter (DMT)-like permease
MLVLAIVCTAAAFVLFLLLITEIGPGRATAITYVNPVVAVALGAVVLGEPLTVSTVVAGLVVLLGTVLVTRPAPPLRRVSAEPVVV